jgi:NTE family protein
MKMDVVMEGGGVKITGLIGAFASLEHAGFELSHIAGTSAGAIVASFAAAGYTSAEMKELAMSLNFSDFKDGAPWGSKMYHLLRHKGIYKGDKLRNYMYARLADKGIVTFKDLRTTETDRRWRWKLKIIASDVSNSRILTLPGDAKLFDMDPDELEVADAVRMSMSIPGFFRPSMLKDNYIVDGGLLSNFPIWLFDSEAVPKCPTFGIILKEPDMFTKNDIGGIYSYMMSIFKTMLRAHDRRAISGQDYFNRLIMAPTGDVATTDFDLTESTKEWLYHSGFTAAKSFLDNWSWPRYVKWAKQQRGIE